MGPNCRPKDEQIIAKYPKKLKYQHEFSHKCKKPTTLRTVPPHREGSLVGILLFGNILEHTQECWNQECRKQDVVFLMTSKF